MLECIDVKVEFQQFISMEKMFKFWHVTIQSESEYDKTHNNTTVLIE